MPRRKRTAADTPAAQDNGDGLECYITLAVAGVGLAAALGGLTYYFYGCAHSPQHRRRMQAALRRMRASIQEQAGMLANMNPAMLRQFVDKALTFYEDVNGAAQSGRRRRTRS